MFDDLPWNIFDELTPPPELYAAGAAIAAWNRCENNICDLMFRVSRIPTECINNIFGLLENQGRMDFLLLEGRRTLNEDELACLSEFTTHFSICRENRNIIAHSMMLTSELFRIDFHKRPRGKGNIMLTFQIDREAMEQVARETIATDRFGHNIGMSVFTHPNRFFPDGLEGYSQEMRDVLTQHFPLPEAPARPRKLNPLPR